MHDRITLEQIALKARQIAQEQPDHVYETAKETCRYFEDERDKDGKPVPGCLFGHAFAALGISAQDVCEGMEVSKILAELGIIPQKWILGSPEPLDVGPDQLQQLALLRALDVTQGSQDAGHPWGAAIEPVEYWFNHHGEPA